MNNYLPDIEDEEATIDALVDTLAQLPLNFHPGDAWEYSRATCVAGKLVEVISGQTLDAFMKERVFEPLGMEDTFFGIPQDKVDRFSVAYGPGEDETIEILDPADEASQFRQRPKGYYMGSGGLVSTAADYFTFQQMMLNGGEYDGVRILGRKTIELITANHTGDLPIWLSGPGYGFGLGYGVKTDLGLSKSPTSVGTFRWGGYYCTTFWVDPVEDIIGILMTQVAPNGHLNVRSDFESVVYAALVDDPR
jgi:CubicO group peptidase (beta-lactamase class C family)